MKKGFLGFMGFLGFLGFLKADFYIFFMFFSFFSFFWDKKNYEHMNSEKYQSNLIKAKAKTLDLSVIMIVAFIISFNFNFGETILRIVFALSFSLLINFKSYLLYLYMK